MIINKNFTLLMMGQFVSGTAAYVFGIVMSLWIKQLSESGTSVGLFLMFWNLPSLLFTPLGGLIADKFSRKNNIVIADFVNGSIMVILGVLLILFSTNEALNLKLCFAVAMISSVVSLIFKASISPLMADIAGSQNLKRAFSISSNISVTSNVLGKSLGGLLISIISVPWIVIINGISMLLSGLSELFIRPLPDCKPEASGSKMLMQAEARQMICEGWSFIRSLPGLFHFATGACVNNFFFMGALTLMPFYIEDYLHVPSQWYGYSATLAAVGSFAGGYIPRKLNRTSFYLQKLVALGLLAPGVVFVLLSFTANLYIALALIFVAHMAFTFVGVSTYTQVAAATPSRLRGRVGAFMNTYVVLLSPLGMLLSGISLDAWGGDVAFIYRICGAGIMFTWLTALLSTQLRHFISL